MFFVQAVEAIRAAGHRVAPLWIGGGDADVEQLLREHGVEVTGWVGHHEVREHLQRADVYLHTARWEGFPITVLEAALSDIPVVVRRIRVFDDAGLPVDVDTTADVGAEGAVGELLRGGAPQARRDLRDQRPARGAPGRVNSASQGRDRGRRP